MEHAGLSSREEDFDSYMDDIKEENPEARGWLNQFPPHQWALAHDNGFRYGIMKIDTDTQDLFDVCDGFLNNTVGMTGGLLHLFDDLRNSFDKSLSSGRDSLNCGDVYTKAVMDKLKEFVTNSITYIITPVEKDTFQVSRTSENEEWIVQLSNSTCTCGEFQSYKLPCVHALAVCDKLKINPLQYVDDCYTLERYCKTYSSKFNPVPEVLAWPEASQVPTLFPPHLTNASSGDES